MSHLSELLLNLLRTKGVIHIIGIGGMAMSAIAAWLIKKGFIVQGSDLEESKCTTILNSLGAHIYKGHHSSNIALAKLIIKSSAVKNDNPEVVKAFELNIPLLSREQILTDILSSYPCTIAISGTHGKTTTTAMLAAIFETAQKNPTVFCGGIINQYKTNFKMGTSDISIVEADESDETFCKLPYKVAVLTNLEPEHLDYYKTFENLKNKNITFIEKALKNGVAVLNIDDPHLFEIKNLFTSKIAVTFPTIITCSLNYYKADFFATNIIYFPRFTIFTLITNSTVAGKLTTVKTIFKLNALGEHNVRNALTAIAVARHLNISLKICKEALEINFNGVQKRFSKLGTINGITIIDDYAHHPTEIFATINSAQQFAESNKIIAVIQPHRYSRVKDLKIQYINLLKTITSFLETVILLPVESGGEAYHEEYNSLELYKTAINIIKDTKKFIYCANFMELLKQVNCSILPAGTLVLFMGAGNTTNLAREFYNLQIVHSSNKKIPQSSHC